MIRRDGFPFGKKVAYLATNKAIYAIFKIWFNIDVNKT